MTAIRVSMPGARCGRTLSLIVFAVLTSGLSVHGSPVRAGDTAFAASPPCDSAIRPLVRVPADLTCDFIRWRLIFQPGEARHFSLTIVFGKAQPNTLWFIGGGRTTSSTGTVEMMRQEHNGQLVQVLWLSRGSSAPPITLLQINENLLQLLQPDGRLMAGNGAGATP